MIAKAERAIAKLRADPLFRMRPKVEDQHPSSGYRDSCGLGNRARWILRMMKCLLQQGDIDRFVLDRQLIELSALLHDVRDTAAPGKSFGAFEYSRRTIDRDDSRRPS